MSLNLISVENAKTPDDEFVILQANAKINLKSYAIVDRTFGTDKQVSDEFRHIFFFPNLVVEKDDFVLLFTGIGTYEGKTEMEDGSVAHLLFWQSSECVWNDNGNDSASLINYTALKTINVPAAKK
jgi:hypothetical protein